MSEPTIEERVARLERHAGLPMGVKEGEARARYFTVDGALWRLVGSWVDTWSSVREWVTSICNMADLESGHFVELTESEAVSRFGREILDEPERKTDTVCPLCGSEHRASDECPQEDETPHARALRELALQPGDRVRVMRNLPDYDGGWTQVWVGRESEPDRLNMDDAVGAVGTVKATLGSEGVSVEIDGPDHKWLFPAHALTVVSRAGEDQSEDEKPDPPKTLADVEPFVMVREGYANGKASDYMSWRDEDDRVITFDSKEPSDVFVDSCKAPDEVIVREVLGPVRVSTSDQAARVKELAQEVERMAAERAERNRYYETLVPPCEFPERFAQAVQDARENLTTYGGVGQVRQMLDNIHSHYMAQAQGGEG